MFKKVDYLNEATHWKSANVKVDKIFNLYPNTIYKIVLILEDDGSNYEHYIVDNKGNLSMSYLCLKGDYLKKKDDFLPRFEECEFWKLSDKQKRKFSLQKRNLKKVFLNYRLQMNDIKATYRMLEDGFYSEEIERTMSEYYKNIEHAKHCINEAYPRYVRKQNLLKINRMIEKAKTAFDTIDFSNITVCGNDECPQKSNCYRYEIYNQLIMNNVVGHTYSKFDSDDCKEFINLNEA